MIDIDTSRDDWFISFVRNFILAPKERTSRQIFTGNWPCDCGDYAVYGVSMALQAGESSHRSRKKHKMGTNTGWGGGSAGAGGSGYVVLYGVAS